MFHPTLFAAEGNPASHMATLLDRVAAVSSRPRYAFILLSLIAEIARPDGSAGPYIRRGDGVCLLRDWLCDALAPMGARDSKRLDLALRVRKEVLQSRAQPVNDGGIETLIAAEVQERIRKSGKTNLSRAISELVNAGLIKRHYQGFRIDHQNRGGGRHAVYTLTGAAKCLIPQPHSPSNTATSEPLQGELRFH